MFPCSNCYVVGKFHSSVAFSWHVASLGKAAQLLPFQFPIPAYRRCPINRNWKLDCVQMLFHPLHKFDFRLRRGWLFRVLWDLCSDIYSKTNAGKGTRWPFSMVSWKYVCFVAIINVSFYMKCLSHKYSSITDNWWNLNGEVKVSLGNVFVSHRDNGKFEPFEWITSYIISSWWWLCGFWFQIELLCVTFNSLNFSSTN